MEVEFVAMGVGCPDWSFTRCVNDEVSIFLHSGVVLSVSACYSFVFSKSFCYVKFVLVGMMMLLLLRKREVLLRLCVELLLALTVVLRLSLRRILAIPILNLNAGLTWIAWLRLV